MIGSWQRSSCAVLSALTMMALFDVKITEAQSFVYTLEQGNSFTAVSPLAGSDDIVTFYGYGTFPGAAASANTGLEKSDTSILFLYKDTTNGELSLVAIHDQQLDGSGATATFTYSISGAVQPTFSAEDDPGEVVDPVYPPAPPFSQTWRWNNVNTDGAALTGGLEGNEWCITIDAFFPPTGGLTPGSITNWEFLTGAGAIPLDLEELPDGTLVGSVTICCCVPVPDPDVRTQGFWKRVCKKPHPSGEHENLHGYVDFVASFAAGTFGDVETAADICDRLNPNPQNSKCEQAEAQFMALMLNVASGRIATCNCVLDPDLGLLTMGEAAKLIDFLLSNADRTFEDCVFAQSLAAAINEGFILVDCP